MMTEQWKKDTTPATSLSGTANTARHEKAVRRCQTDKCRQVRTKYGRCLKTMQPRNYRKNSGTMRYDWTGNPFGRKNLCRKTGARWQYHNPPRKEPSGSHQLSGRCQKSFWRLKDYFWMQSLRGLCGILCVCTLSFIWKEPYKPYYTQ